MGGSGSDLITCKLVIWSDPWKAGSGLKLSAVVTQNAGRGFVRQEARGTVISGCLLETCLRLTARATSIRTGSRFAWCMDAGQSPRPCMAAITDHAAMRKIPRTFTREHSSGTLQRCESEDAGASSLMWQGPIIRMPGSLKSWPTKSVPFTQLRAIACAAFTILGSRKASWLPGSGSAQALSRASSGACRGRDRSEGS